MATELSQEEKITDRWFKRVSPQLKDCDSCLILGYGSGQHIHRILREYPDKTLTLIDPRFSKFNPVDGIPLRGAVFSSIRFLGTLQVLRTLRLELETESLPSCVLCFRPSWGNHGEFFEAALEILGTRTTPLSLMDSHRDSEFILRSLFV